MRDILSKLDAIEQQSDLPEIGDAFGISLSEDFEISTEIIGFTADGIVVAIDEEAQNILESQGVGFYEGYLEEGLRDPKDNPCWKGYKPVGTKKKNGKTVPNCVPKESIEEEKQKGVDGKACWKGYRRQGTKMKGGRRVDNCVKVGEDIDVDEAEYQGKDVPLGKKLPGDVKKYKVYVKNPQGNVVKVNFGDKKMRIKKSNPNRRKSFRARHNCENPGPRHKARYWSCRNW